MNKNKIAKKIEEYKQDVKALKKEVDLNVGSKVFEKVDNTIDFYNKLSPTQKEALKKELELKKIRDSYIKYLKYVYPDFIITKFHAFLANLCQSVVEKVERGETVRLLVSVPFRHGKTTAITKTLPSWFVGRNPGKWSILTAYNADIAEEFSDNNRQLIKNFGKEIFGIETNSSQDNKTLFQTHKVGQKENPNLDSGIMGVGITGGIVGHGGSLIIVDDPYKNAVDANNKQLRDTIYNIFTSAVLTRATGKGNAIIVIHTRWDDDDLIGRLAKTGDWIYVNIPAVWEKGIDKLLGRKVGETLCPELGFDAEWVERTRKALGNRLFNANCQGKPYIESGNIINRSDIKFYNKNNCPSAFEEIVLSCDLSFGGTKKSNDPYCMSLWGRNGGNHYLINVWDKRKSFTETNNTIRIICDQYPTLRKKLIERKANGQATIDLMSKEISGLVPFEPKGQSKEDRLNAVSPYFESGNVYFPDESVLPNVEEYVEQLLRFPNGTHDDFVDTVSQYLLNYQYKYGGRVATDSGFLTLANAIRGF